jgi:hypothetical protein
MATPQDSRIVHEMGFAPLDPIDVSVGRMNIKLYPKIMPLMPVYERAHAFQVNKTALKDLPTDLRLIIDAFGLQLNASSTVESILSNWHHYFLERWMDFGHLTILSFHNSKGNWMDDTTTANNAQVLLPVINGTLVDCRKQDVRFMRVQCTLDFTPLITVDPYPVSSILRVSYYIKLPQTMQGMTNGNNVAYNLTSYLGPDDLRTLTPDMVRTTILRPVLQDRPVLLEAPDFNLQNATTNSIGIAMEMDGKILKLAWHQLCTSIFNKFCPGYSNQSQAAFEHIKQLYLDTKENLVWTPVFAYYQRMINAMRLFASKARFPKSVCNALIDGLDKRLIAIFRRNYPNHAVLHDLQGSFQRSHLPIILDAMTMAEEEVQSISAIARSSVGSQAFKLDALAFPSQAERTLDRYSGGYSSELGSAGGYHSDSGYQSD